MIANQAKSNLQNCGEHECVAYTGGNEDGADQSVSGCFKPFKLFHPDTRRFSRTIRTVYFPFCNYSGVLNHKIMQERFFDGCLDHDSTRLFPT